MEEHSGFIVLDFAYNRTIQELKFVGVASEVESSAAYNRTIQELK